MSECAGGWVMGEAGGGDVVTTAELVMGEEKTVFFVMCDGDCGSVGL